MYQGIGVVIPKDHSHFVMQADPQVCIFKVQSNRSFGNINFLKV